MSDSEGLEYLRSLLLKCVEGKISLESKSYFQIMDVLVVTSLSGPWCSQDVFLKQDL